MNCMKCGREIGEESVFCPECLAVMEKYPIKRDTPVQIPKRDVSEALRKAARRRERTPEEQILRLRSTVSRQRLLLLLLAAALGVFIWLYFTTPQPTESQPENPIGQNYTVDITTTDDHVSRETIPSLTISTQP